MTTTTFTINSPGLGTLSPNENIYAYAFDQNANAYPINGTSNYITIAQNGTTTGSGLANQFTVTDGANGLGNYLNQVFVLIQYGGSAPVAPTNASIDTAAAAQSGNYSFMLFETALDNNPNDFADISSLNNFGFTGSRVIGSNSVGFNSPANTILNTLNTYNSNASQTFHFLGLQASLVLFKARTLWERVPQESFTQLRCGVAMLAVLRLAH